MNKFEKLETAIKSGDLALINTLVVQYTMDVDQPLPSGKLPLRIAINNKRQNIAMLLLEYGASINRIETEDNKSILQNAFDEAWMFDNFADLQFLSECGIQMEQIDDAERTLLMAAVWYSEKLTSFLIDRGANPNSQDKNGWTPLMYAVSYEASSLKIPEIKKIVSILLSRGADLHIMNNRGQTAYDIANSEPLIEPQHLHEIRSMLGPA